MGNNTVAFICKIFSGILLALALLASFSEGFWLFLSAIPVCLLFVAIAEIIEHVHSINTNTYAIYQQISKHNDELSIWYCPKCGIGNDGDSLECKNCGNIKK